MKIYRDSKENTEEKIINQSQIAKLKYFKKEKEMMLTFILTDNYGSGKSYLYNDVPYEVFVNLSNANSPGAFFNREIRGNYGYKQIH